MNHIPLVVDLDGTLIHGDMLHESALSVGGENPAVLLHLPRWLAQGKSALKTELSARFEFNVEHLPYNAEVLAWLRTQKASGRSLILCSASHRSIVQKVANHLQIFDDVMATQGSVNLEGKQKAAALTARYGAQGFDYVGNSKADLHVWKQARRAIVVNAHDKLAARAREVCEVEAVFGHRPAGRIASWRRALRLHQWLKNSLLFVPLLAAHQLSQGASWLTLLWCFLSFSLCASSVYITNDLLDLESDRKHPRKCLRPFASGALAASQGLLVAVGLLVAAFGLASAIGPAFLAWLAVYFTVTTVYSFRLKKVILLDCIVLAFLYTVRIIAGASALALPLTFWLLAFSGFLFLSLAFVKRYAELQVQLLAGKTKAHGRGYLTSDAPLVQMLGISAGYSAVLVLALYLNSDTIVKLYHTPTLMWATVPVIAFWINWMWLKAHRGEMHDDPVVFATRDRASLAAGLLFVVMLVLGARSW